MQKAGRSNTGNVPWVHKLKIVVQKPFVSLRLLPCVCWLLLMLQEDSRNSLHYPYMGQAWILMAAASSDGINKLKTCISLWNSWSGWWWAFSLSCMRQWWLYCERLSIKWNFCGEERSNLALVTLVQNNKSKSYVSELWFSYLLQLQRRLYLFANT